MTLACLKRHTEKPLSDEGARHGDRSSPPRRCRWDGYIAKDNNTIGRLFDWPQNGAVKIPTVDNDITLHLSPSGAEYWKQ
jgi:hypothetical protein